MELAWFIAAALLPLFPFSIAFNRLLQRVPSAWGRALLLLLWPQAGVWLLAAAAAKSPAGVPEWLLVWALLTALLYAFRSLALRSLTVWIGFVATSAWALFPLLVGAAGPVPAPVQLLGFSVPLALLALLSGELERRYGAAYAGLPGALAQRLPRFSLVLVVTLLAVIATPVFPAFFSLLAALVQGAGPMPAVTLAMLTTWLLWSWSAARLAQGLIVGPGKQVGDTDLGIGAALGYTAGLVALAASGLAIVGGMV